MTTSYTAVYIKRMLQFETFSRYKFIGPIKMAQNRIKIVVR